MTVTDAPGSPRPARSHGRALLNVLLSRRLRPLWITAGLVLAVFNIFRFALLVVNLDFVRDVGLAHVGRCFWVGLRFDIVPIGYMLLPMALGLSLAPAEAFSRKKFKRLVAGYGTALVLLAFFVEVVGAAYFADSGARLNWAALNYPRHPKEIIGHIWRAYPVWLLLPVMSVLGYLVYRLLSRWFGGADVSARTVRAKLAWAGSLTVLLVLCCRGGVDNLPLSSSSAYFSTNNIISQLAMNNFFTFFRAARSTLTEGANEAKEYSLPSLGRAQQVVLDMLYQPGQVSAETAANPFWRRVQTGRPMQDLNVVIILMEGMAGEPVGSLGNKTSYTPNLDAICREGLYFERMYAVGSRTSRGMVGVLCGHPDVHGVSVLERERAQGNFLTLPMLFLRRDYETVFVYGGDANFDNMRGFFSAGGIDQIIDQADIAAPEIAGNWGLPDEVLFDEAHAMFEAMGKRKFFGVILTVSNHQPYEIPAGRIDLLPGMDEEIRRLNAYRYADWALGRFFDRARQADYFDRTVFVLVADHGHGLNPARGIDVPGYRIPCVIYAPGRIQPRRIATVASQTDIAPTLLSLLGGSYEHCFLGRDLLAVAPGDGFAVLHQDDYLGIVRGQHAVIVPPNVEPPKEPIAVLYDLDEFSMAPIPPSQADQEIVDDLQMRMLSYYRIGKHLYDTNAFRFLPERTPSDSK